MALPLSTLEQLATAAESSGSERDVLTWLIPLLTNALQQDAQEALWYCAITRWFNVETIAWMRGENEGYSERALEIYQLLQSYTFVAPYPPFGYAYHEDVRASLLGSWRSNREEEYRAANNKVAAYFRLKTQGSSGAEREIYWGEYEFHAAIGGSDPVDLDVFSHDELVEYIQNRLRVAAKPSEIESIDEGTTRLLAIYLRNLRVGRVAAARQESSSTDRVVFARQYIDRLVEHFIENRRRIDGLRAGQEPLWTRLFEQVRGIVEWMPVQAFDEDQAEDLTQLAMLHFLKPDAFESYPFDVSFSSWLRIVVKSVVLAQLRRSERMAHSNLSVEQIIDSSFDEDDELDSKRQLDPLTVALNTLVVEDEFLRATELTTSIEHALELLPSSLQKQILKYSIVDGLSDHDIAQLLGKPLSSVVSNRYRAIKLLRNQFVHLGKRSLWD